VRAFKATSMTEYLRTCEHPPFRQFVRRARAWPTVVNAVGHAGRVLTLSDIQLAKTSLLSQSASLAWHWCSPSEITTMNRSLPVGGPSWFCPTFFSSVTCNKHRAESAHCEGRASRSKCFAPEPKGLRAEASALLRWGGSAFHAQRGTLLGAPSR
jgi:hypothetical protein